MKEIKLTQGKTALVDDEDYEFLNQWKWHTNVSGYNIYARRDIQKNGVVTHIHMHRVITNAPKGMDVDHKDHNGLNNQKSNLRICTASQNGQNRMPFSGRKYHGVYHSIMRGKWEYIRARIILNGKGIWLGQFDTEEAAARAYDAKAKELFGEFAYLNFPET